MFQYRLNLSDNFRRVSRALYIERHKNARLYPGLNHSTGHPVEIQRGVHFDTPWHHLPLASASFAKAAPARNWFRRNVCVPLLTLAQPLTHAPLTHALPLPLTHAPLLLCWRLTRPVSDTTRNCRLGFGGRSRRVTTRKGLSFFAGLTEI
jgi:hypothetical protein